jgi:hypothetical protein
MRQRVWGSVEGGVVCKAQFLVRPRPKRKWKNTPPIPAHKELSFFVARGSGKFQGEG